MHRIPSTEHLISISQIKPETQSATHITVCPVNKQKARREAKVDLEAVHITIEADGAAHAQVNLIIVVEDPVVSMFAKTQKKARTVKEVEIIGNGFLPYPVYIGKEKIVEVPGQENIRRHAAGLVDLQG